MDANDRIRQFEKMAHDDPDNDMAHYSLGDLYARAGRYSDAAAAFGRCVALSPHMSKAYQLAGDALIRAGQKDAAADLLERGYRTAHERGDLMPKKAIGAMLESLGRTPPALGATGATPAAAPVAAPPGSFVDRRTNRPGTKLERRPFKGPVGEWIWANISAETWDAWIRQGTKVINEMRLDLSRDDHQEVYDQHMREYLGLDDETLAAIRARS
ncbi:MAG: Fe(2+)-trafficking protein [Phycisphaerae bacterium]|nr:Fe(2+)-trafficking protein [Phycisphaerae bacterium]